MRGSDASAALYWLARMLEGGENPLYIARRLIRFASEDIGNSLLPELFLFFLSCFECINVNNSVKIVLPAVFN